MKNFDIVMQSYPDDWQAKYAEVPVLRGVNLVLVQSKK